MGLSVDVVKRSGTQDFMREKLHASIIAACMSVRTPAGQAESIANSVCDNVSGWLQDKPEVTSRDLRIVTVRHLHVHHPDAAYMYEQYLLTI